MPLIQIEPDDPEVVSRARVTITNVVTATSESEVSLNHAIAQGWIDALSSEGLISHDLSLTLGGELEAARRTWKRPERGQGGDYV
ncbi:hypothetical protein CCU68_34315 [Pseudomonas gingeri NCPPB 3146 = LMG 5327]|uniref:Uncharacterized protein n=2 Tax=Pseudomonas gingeri TaxID=117681 RepID=A0A7Y7Y2U7_9PSED|nr:hypothetical protein [Pseudomonas gingeri]NWC16566.1 hypothetical protein [Pseudomonas gingeri]PNQ87908.1 hypothetical protein CCU68_34315 [Pseudomonas gingeri NCPPB 3146 = LMG 5327]